MIYTEQNLMKQTKAELVDLLISEQQRADEAVDQYESEVEAHQESCGNYDETIDKLNDELYEILEESSEAQLKHLAEQYLLNDSQHTLNEVLKLLEDSYGLKLIVAPAKNQ